MNFCYMAKYHVVFFAHSKKFQCLIVIACVQLGFNIVYEAEKLSAKCYVEASLLAVISRVPGIPKEFF